MHYNIAVAMAATAVAAANMLSIVIAAETCMQIVECLNSSYPVDFGLVRAR